MMTPDVMTTSDGMCMMTPDVMTTSDDDPDVMMTLSYGHHTDVMYNPVM